MFPWFAQLRDNAFEGQKHGCSFDVPEELARQFHAEPGGIARAAVEALAAEGVRSGKLTVYQARQMLGIRSRYGMDGFLKARGLLLSDTIQQVVADGGDGDRLLEMTVVIADTSPVNYLVLIGEIAILPRLYGQVLIPPEVLAELSDADAPLRSFTVGTVATDLAADAASCPHRG